MTPIPTDPVDKLGDALDIILQWGKEHSSGEPESKLQTYDRVTAVLRKGIEGGEAFDNPNQYQ